MRPRNSHLRAVNDNAMPDRAAAIVVAIGQISTMIASISGIVATAWVLARG